MQIDKVGDEIHNLWSSLLPPVDTAGLRELIAELANASPTTAAGVGWWVAALSGAKGKDYDVQRLARDARVVAARVHSARLDGIECALVGTALTNRRDFLLRDKLRVLQQSAAELVERSAVIAHFIEDTVEDYGTEVAAVRAQGRGNATWLATIERALAPIIVTPDPHARPELDTSHTLGAPQLAMLRQVRHERTYPVRSEPHYLACPRCAYTWVARVASPRRCPRCQAKFQTADDGNATSPPIGATTPVLYGQEIP